MSDGKPDEWTTGYRVGILRLYATWCLTRLRYRHPGIRVKFWVNGEPRELSGSLREVMDDLKAARVKR
jgi:hypothetical protein